MLFDTKRQKIGLRPVNFIFQTIHSDKNRETRMTASILKIQTHKRVQKNAVY